MKMTKRIAAMAACAVMAASSMVGMGASAITSTNNIPYEEISTLSDTAPVGLISELHTVFNIPRYKQTGNTCWLECIRSIVNYKLGTTYSADDIRTIMKESPTITPSSNGGLNQDNTVALLNRIFKKNSSALKASLTKRPLSYAEIKKLIDKDMPFILIAKNSATGAAHDVVVSGYATCWRDFGSYKTGDYTGLVLMNPQDGSEAFYYDSDTSDTAFSFTNYQNTTYDWYQTIKIE